MWEELKEIDSEYKFEFPYLQTNKTFSRFRSTESVMNTLLQAYLIHLGVCVTLLQAHLIHLGAKYSPCMRRDENVMKEILDDRLQEKETACCIQNDGSGCRQSNESSCSVS